MSQRLRNINNDLVGGLLAAGFGLAMLVWLVPNYVEEDADLRLPVSTMPTLVAWLLVGLGTLQAIISQTTNSALHETDAPSSEGRKFVGLIGLMGLASVALIWLPYLVVAPVLLGCFAWAFGQFRPVLFLGLVTLAPLSIYLIVTFGFDRVLP